MSHAKVFFMLVGVALTISTIREFRIVPPVLEIEDTWWGQGSPPEFEDTRIKSFKINISKEIINNLYKRLNSTPKFQPSLNNVNNHYGINTDLLRRVLHHWKDEYDWPARQKFLNRFPQFKTNIKGLKIHFVHVRPQNVRHDVEVLPLLMVHGWPGTFRDFYELIPILTKPEKEYNFVFEVIIPSLPGFGFSDAANIYRMDPLQMASIFNTLMKRLKFDRYYVQGDGWGSVVARDLALLHPESVIGVHRNWCTVNLLYHWQYYVGILFPTFFFTHNEIVQTYPIRKRLLALAVETGYVHIQGMRPDTLGIALRESPAGLAAYILDQFIVGPKKELANGGLTEKLNINQILDNIMIYWVTKSITTSMRFHGEIFSRYYQYKYTDLIPVQVPAGCVRFTKEVLASPQTLLKGLNKKLIHLTDYEGGRFSAMEAPLTISSDIFGFVKKVRKLQNKTTNKKEL